MTPTDLIALAHRKNEAHTLLTHAKASLRKSAGYGKMTEKDRDIAMEDDVRTYREAYENLCDEFAIWMAELANVS